MMTGRHGLAVLLAGIFAGAGLQGYTTRDSG
jgi:hypothetical protein